MRLTARLLTSVGGALLLASPTLATWSIVVVDHATQEVGIAGATCIENLQVQRFIAVVSVGKGVGAAQNVVDPTAQNRILMLRGMEMGLTAEEILDDLATLPSFGASQLGIATLAGPAAFSNSGGAAALGVTGELGSMSYAIGGNVLAGNAVVFEAERAFLGSSGDMGQRLMAAMEAARAFGGDGRCSCDADTPTACGSPPPAFDKSAHTSFIVVARIGDQDGVCNSDDGCANGTYYLNRNVRGDFSDPDPVDVLRERYDTWRVNRIGVADGLLSRVEPAATSMPADGTTTTTVTVRLRDLDDNPLAFGGFPLAVREIDGPQPASVESVEDNGDGTYSIILRAGTEPGQGRWRIVALQGARPRTLHPPLELEVAPVTPLHIGLVEVSASEGADVPLVTNAGANEAGRSYLVLASASGTSPGTPFSGGVLPLNADRLLRFTFMNPGPPTFPGSMGQLDGAGRAEASLRASTAMLSPFIGGRFDFSTVLFGSPDEFTAPVGFDILP